MNKGGFIGIADSFIRLLSMTFLSQILALLVFSSFAIGLTFGIKYYLNPDKASLPWRAYCQSEHPTYYALQFPPGHKAIYRTHTDEYEENQVFATLPPSAPELLVPINSSSPIWPFAGHADPPFSSESTELDLVDPVGVFVGVFSTDSARERRMLIRQTYGTHWKSRVSGTEGVRLKFILGLPRPKYENLVQLEMATYGDIVILDIPENMNAGKTHAFFTWAAENATVPDLDWARSRPQPEMKADSHLHAQEPSEHYSSLGRRSFDVKDQSDHLISVMKQQHTMPHIDFEPLKAYHHYKGKLFNSKTGDIEAPAEAASDVKQLNNGGNVSVYAMSIPEESRHYAMQMSSDWAEEDAYPIYRGERKPDYVVKADEDSFIMLGELERRLRASPRKMSYWGCE